MRWWGGWVGGRSLWRGIRVCWRYFKLLPRISFIHHIFSIFQKDKHFKSIFPYITQFLIYHSYFFVHVKGSTSMVKVFFLFLLHFSSLHKPSYSHTTRGVWWCSKHWLLCRTYFLHVNIKEPHIMWEIFWSYLLSKSIYFSA